MATVLIKRGTRAQLDAAAAASGLKQGELYLITDESTLAVGTAANAYVALGTIATQDADAVAITGGTVSGLTSMSAATLAGTGLTSGYLPKAGTGGLLGNSPVYTDGTKVGIGTPTPSSLLHTYKITGDNLTTFQAGTSALSIYTNSFYSPAFFWKTGQDLGFFATADGITPTGASARHVTIQSGGNVLIGTTTSTGPKLEVAGAAKATDLTVNQGALTLTPVAAPGAPTLSATTAGSKPAGTWNVKCTWVTATGETALGTVSSNITVDGSKAITTTQPASPPALATGWKVYSSKQGPTATWWVTSGTIPIATTTYDDNASDAALTVDATSRETTAGRRVFVGASPSLTITPQSVRVGDGAGASITTGGTHVLIGGAAGQLLSTSSNDVAIGYTALLSATGGANRTIVGAFAGRSITTAAGVVAVGLAAGYQSGATPSSANAVTTGSNNTFLGALSGLGSSTQRSNSTAIGYAAYVDADNRVVLGNGSVVDVWAGSTGQALMRAGSFATTATARTAANGLNSNVTGGGFLRITGPTAAFSIGGLTLGQDGREVKLYNTTAYAMTIVNEDASSTAANRITTLTGADVVLRTGPSFATLTYDATASRWILSSYN